MVQALGAVGMVRFMQQFEIGSGDYTRDRAQVLANATLEETVSQIKQHRRMMDA